MIYFIANNGGEPENGFRFRGRTRETERRSLRDERETDRQTQRHKDKETNRQTDRQTDRVKSFSIRNNGVFAFVLPGAITPVAPSFGHTGNTTLSGHRSQ